MYNINWFSPLPPALTDIGHYTFRIASALNTESSVWFYSDLVTDDFKNNFRFRYLKEYKKDIIGAKDFFGINFYNIGNDVRFHGDIMSIAAIYSGFVVLHDTNIHHSVYERFRNDPEKYVALSRNLYGRVGEEIARSIVINNGSNINEFVDNMTFSELFFERTLGMVVHSNTSATQLESLGAPPVLVLPLPFESAYQVTKKGLDGPLRFVMFGYLGSNRRLDAVLDALHIVKDEISFSLDIYGTLNGKEEVLKKIGEMDMADRITCHGFVSEKDLNYYIGNADLVFNLRYPSMGEASGSLLRGWFCAAPVVVSDHGWYSELPDNVVIKIKVDQEISDLCDVIKRIDIDKDAFREIGLNGWKHWRVNHRAEKYVSNLTSALDEFNEVFSIKIAAMNCKKFHHRGTPIIDNELYKGRLIKHMSDLFSK